MKNLYIILTLFLMNNCSSTPVMDAIDKHDFLTVKTIIEGGGNPNEQDCISALTLASWLGEKEIVEYLLQKGANPNHRSKQCIHYDKFAGKFKAEARTPIQDVKNVEIAKILFDKGANPNLGGFREFTNGNVYPEVGLLNAIKYGNIELIEFYLSRKVNLKLYYLDGENIFLSFLGNLNKNSEKIKSLFQGKLSNLDLSPSKLNSTEGKIYDTYIHIPTGAKTKMDSELAKKLYENPKNFAPITFNAADNRYYHYTEFTWENGMNMYEWYILRYNKVNPKPLKKVTP